MFLLSLFLSEKKKIKSNQNEWNQFSSLLFQFENTFPIRIISFAHNTVSRIVHETIASLTKHPFRSFSFLIISWKRWKDDESRSVERLFIIHVFTREERGGREKKGGDSIMKMAAASSRLIIHKLATSHASPRYIERFRPGRKLKEFPKRN